MNRYAYAEKRESVYRLFSFHDGEALETSSDVRAVMMSRLDFDVHVVELPAIPEREIEGFLKYRIPGLYPGHPEQTAFDYRILTCENRKFAVLFLVRGSDLEEYRRVAGGRPLFLPFSLVQQQLKKGACRNLACLFWHEAWFEILIFRAAEPFRSIVLKRSKKPESDLERFGRFASQDAVGLDWVIFCSRGEIEGIEPGIRTLVADDRSVSFVATEDALMELSGRECFLFEPRRRKAILPRTVRLQVYLTAIVLLALLAFKRTVDADQHYLERLKQQGRVLQDKNAAAIALQEEIDSLEKELDALQMRRPVDPYRVLSELQTVLTSDTSVRSFILERNFFQLEAVGINPLGLMEVFRGKELFEEVKLIQIVPQSNSDREIFKITGTVRVE